MDINIEKNDNNMSASNHKGFTLVELIVVLVILAILAAFLLPALLGYIDRAKGAQVLIDAREQRQLAQTVFIEYYAKHPDYCESYYNRTRGGFTDDEGNFNKACVLTHSTLATIQGMVKNGTYDTKMQEYYELSKSSPTSSSYFFYSIASDILRRNNSFDNKDNLNFGPGIRASNVTYSEFLTTTGATKANPLIYQLYFDGKGKIIMFEYGADGYLVRFYNDEVTVEKDGKTFTSN